MEILDILDENGNIIGVEERKVVHQKAVKLLLWEYKEKLKKNPKTGT